MNTQHQNSIAHYLSRRIHDNANWYQQRGFIDDFSLSARDDMIFYLTHFVISHVLHDGHTVLLLKNDDICEGRLQSWQETLLMPIMTIINDDVGNVLDFDEIFSCIERLSHDEMTLTHYINQQQERLVELYHQQTIHRTNRVHHQENEQVLAQLKELFIHVLRFYYLTTILLHQDFDEFIKRLYVNPLFVHSHHEPLDRAIVFYHDDKGLYLWLNRSFVAEQELLSAIMNIQRGATETIYLSQVNPSLNREQQHAIYQASKEALTIITGGPGTGKTFTVAQMVLAFHEALSAQNRELNLALVAPTGKASQRMAESLQNALICSKANLILPEPMTIHRLLGIGMNGTPRHHISNPLPYDLIIVDEASMLGTELARHLLCAVKRGARIVLLGDAHQLSAVDAGAVLADLCKLPHLSSARTHLIESNRFSASSSIGQLAELINRKEIITDRELMTLINQHESLSFSENMQPIFGRFDDALMNEFYQNLAHDYAMTEGFFAKTKTLYFTFHEYSQTEKAEALQVLTAIFNRYRILTASHLGWFGDHHINDFIENMHRDYLKVRNRQSVWYHGRPVMILKNRYDLGLFNGDIGICLQSGKRSHELSVYFMSEQVKVLPISLLDGDIANTAYAMTIHKSQGSEFDKVAVVFGDDNERLLSKELIYTAVTRAKSQVAIYSSKQALLKAINTPTIRQTGLLIHDIPSL